ncbi:permease [Janthinobacterium sp. 17J80-10]|uniref:permease n=1 Tax=Janthinobacterium sp. 17J80-10 TaxID=2497863 RepID=UPI00100572BC|nr:permease [Janthinobacterium sp. 17J80-10]QAU35354.1 permease [Janthinobacterium sp. 17J80-10]
MQRILSFEQTPALLVPLRFMLTAPLFALLAAALMFWSGPDMLASRWLPATLAFTHLLTIGFLSMTMVGALIQILQVVAGIEIARPRLTAAIVHTTLAVGCILLSLAFLRSEAMLFRLALACLGTGFLWLLAACGIGVWRDAQPTATVTAIRFSLAGLAVALSLGVTAASAFAWPLALPLIELTNLHAAWGLLAWVGLLTIGVAYQVVPMFQVTPVYPVFMTRWLSWAILAGLCSWSASRLFPAPVSGWLADLASLALCAAFLGFGVQTLRLLAQRKRPPDATTQFWRTSLLCLIASALLWLAGEWMPAAANAAWLPISVGALFIVGFGCTVVNGMLYKIVPFLIWYHLQHQLASQGRKAPNVRQIITDRAASRQFQVQFCAIVLMTAAPIWPEMLARLAALAFGISACWLGINLAHAAGIYRTALAEPAPGERRAPVTL